MAVSAAELVKLNKNRWDANLESAEAPQAVPTAGLVFFRGDPKNSLTGEIEVPWDRETKDDGPSRQAPQYYKVVDKSHAPYASAEEQQALNKLSVLGQRKSTVVKTSGDSDCFALKPWSRFKYRIPYTSVVHREGDLSVCCCFGGFKPTAAQVLWFVNFICFLVHTSMVFVTLYFAYWRWGRSINDADHMMVTIYRVSQIPTPKMMEEDNATHTVWDNSTRWANQFYLHENGMKVNFATLVLSFFAISAVFHLLACVLGAFERWYIDSLPTTLFRIS